LSFRCDRGRLAVSSREPAGPISSPNASGTIEQMTSLALPFSVNPEHDTLGDSDRAGHAVRRGEGFDLVIRTGGEQRGIPA
jgi:hypothetical protein